MNRRTFLCIPFFASALLSFGGGVNFPTERSCISPDLRWTIRCVTEKERDGYLHKLILSRLASVDEKLVYASGRNCDVLWSDDSQRLAITDWSGSSTAEIYLVNIAEPGKPVALEVQGLAKIVERAQLEGHCYYEALWWETSRRLLICVFGHTDENPSHGFAYYLSVNIDTGIAKLVKRENEESSRHIIRVHP